MLTRRGAKALTPSLVRLCFHRGLRSSNCIQRLMLDEEADEDEGAHRLEGAPDAMLEPEPEPEVVVGVGAEAEAEGAVAAAQGGASILGDEDMEAALTRAEALKARQQTL